MTTVSIPLSVADPSSTLATFGAAVVVVPFDGASDFLSSELHALPRTTAAPVIAESCKKPRRSMAAHYDLRRRIGLRPVQVRDLFGQCRDLRLELGELDAYHVALRHHAGSGCFCPL